MSWPPARLRQRNDHGAAVPEFLMVTVLLLVVAVGVFQVGLALYVRNTLISAAVEGARYGARADAQPGDATARTAALITAALSPSFADDVSESEVTENGVRVVRIQVTAALPMLGLLGPDSLSVNGRAFAEEQVGGPP